MEAYTLTATVISDLSYRRECRTNSYGGLIRRGVYTPNHVLIVVTAHAYRRYSCALHHYW